MSADDNQQAAGKTGDALDWHAFCAEHFPGRTERHNLMAVVAYGEYRTRQEGAEQPVARAVDILSPAPGSD